jgi:hypothetical protein
LDVHGPSRCSARPVPASWDDRYKNSEITNQHQSSAWVLAARVGWWLGVCVCEGGETH